MYYVIKPIFNLSIIMCMIFPLFLFSCARTSNSQQGEMASFMAVLKVLDVSANDAISVRIEFTLKNMSANSLEVLKWGTPFEGEFTDNMFAVQLDGKPVRYTGIQIKRGAPRKEDFVEIGPHGELSVTVLLEKGYDIQETGMYSVQYDKPYISVRSNDGKEQLVAVHSNSVVFNVVK